MAGKKRVNFLLVVVNTDQEMKQSGCLRWNVIRNCISSYASDDENTVLRNLLSRGIHFLAGYIKPIGCESADWQHCNVLESRWLMVPEQNIDL